MTVIDIFLAADGKSRKVKKDYNLREDLKKSAQTTQSVKAGEEVSVIETRKDWSNIRVTSTGATGWIPNKNIES